MKTPQADAALQDILASLRATPAHWRRMHARAFVLLRQPDREAEVMSMTDHEVLMLQRAMYRLSQRDQTGRWT